MIQGEPETSGPSDADVAQAAGEASAHAQHAEAAAAEVREDAQESAAAAESAAGSEAEAQASAGEAEDHADQAGHAAEAAMTAEAHMVSLLESLPERIAEAVNARIQAESAQVDDEPERRPPTPGKKHWLYRRVGGRGDG